MADIKALAEELVNLTVKEVNELATILKEEYGIEPAAAAVAVAAGPAAGAPAAEEKSSFDVVLKWLTVLPLLLRKASPKLTLKPSRSSSKRLVLKLSSNNIA